MMHRFLRPLATVLALSAVAASPASVDAQDDVPVARPAPPPMGPQVQRGTLPPPPAAEGAEGAEDDAGAPPSPGTSSASRAQRASDDDLDAIAQDDEGTGEEADAEGEGEPSLEPEPPKQVPPKLDGAVTVNIDFVETPLSDVVKFMAQVTGRNFILTDDLKGEVTIISHKPVPVSTAYEAFISALEVHGYTTVTVGGEAGFGRGGSVPVSLIEPNAPLQTLHEALVGVVEALPGRIATPGYTMAGFRPHVSHRGEKAPRAGGQLVLDQIALVDMAPDGGHATRRVLTLWQATL